MEEIEAELNELLRKTALKLNFKNYSTDLNLKGLKGDGYMSELFLVKLRNEDTKETVDIAIKKAFKNPKKREEFTTSIAFKNEIQFYLKIFPKLDSFQKSKNVKEPFDCIPDFYAALREEGSESLALENLKSSGFDTLDRKLHFSQSQMEFLLKQYGKWHALSFALKDQNPEEYEALYENVEDFFSLPKIIADFMRVMSGNCKDAFESIADTHPEFLEKYKDYWSNDLVKPLEDFHEKQDKHSCLIHGDCWSNNLMLKLDQNQIISLKMIDFQLICQRNPVYDLSYLFYSGGNGEMFNKLDYYLQIYYDSFSSFLTELGSNPNIYTIRDLRDDWKTFGKFGLVMALMLVKIKLSTQEGIDLIVNDDDVKVDDFNKISYDTELYSKWNRDLILHGISSGVL